jgi:hypothetical protein
MKAKLSEIIPRRHLGLNSRQGCQCVAPHVLTVMLAFPAASPLPRRAARALSGPGRSFWASTAVSRVVDAVSVSSV